MSEITLKDLVYDNGSRCNRYTKIRSQARAIAKKLRMDKCCKCGYDKHVEIAHIKPISSFSLDSKIEEINSPENLLALCPNCHWEMDNINRKKFTCCECGIEISRGSKKCKECFTPYNKNKICKRVFEVDKEELERLVWEMPTTKVAKQFGVSDKAIQKRCELLEINKPPRGYWRKLETGKL